MVWDNPRGILEKDSLREILRFVSSDFGGKLLFSDLSFPTVMWE